MFEIPVWNLKRGGRSAVFWVRDGVLCDRGLWDVYGQKCDVQIVPDLVEFRARDYAVHLPNLEGRRVCDLSSFPVKKF